MMQKKLFVLALAAAISAPAFADTSNVNVYGGLDMAYTNISTGSAANGTPGVSTNNISSQVTKLGFKGSEDLGDGLSAIWQIEQQIDIDNSGATASTSPAGTGKSTFATRNSFLGLKSEGMGTVLMGTHDTPYKISTRKLDLFGDQIADNRSLMGGSAATGSGGGGHDLRPNNVLAYISPNMNGFTGAVAYVAGAESSTLSTQTKGAAWSLAGMYDDGPLYLALGYQVIDYGSANSGTLAGTANNKFKGTKLGVGYKFDALQLNAIWEKTAYTNASGAADAFGRTDWYLGAKYSFGNDDIKLAYGKAGNPSGSTNVGATQISLGYDHSLSKRTTVYAQYTTINNDTGASYTITSAGSTAGGQALPGAGSKPSAFALGIKHSF